MPVVTFDSQAALVKESLTELRTAKMRAHGKRKPIIDFLILVKSGKAKTGNDVVGMLGYSKGTVSKWWKLYLEAGLEGIVGRHA